MVKEIRIFLMTIPQIIYDQLFNFFPHHHPLMLSNSNKRERNNFYQNKICLLRKLHLHIYICIIKTLKFIALQKYEKNYIGRNIIIIIIKIILESARFDFFLSNYSKNFTLSFFNWK